MKKENLLSVGLAALAALESHQDSLTSVEKLKELFCVAADAIAAYDVATAEATSAAEKAVVEAVNPAVKATPTKAIIEEARKGLAHPKAIVTQQFSVSTGRETSNVSDKERRLIKRLVLKEMGDDEIAVELARPTSTVANVRRAAGLKPRNGAPAPRRTRKRRGPTTASAVRCLFELYLRDYSLGRAAETADLSQVVAKNLLDEAGILRDRTESARARVRFEACCNGKIPTPSKEWAAQKAAELVDEMLRRRRGA